MYRDGYEAVFIATGAPKPLSLGIEGEELPEVMKGLDLLQSVATGEFVTMGAKVSVFGGDKVAVDCARTALRLGAQEVSIFCLEEREIPAFARGIEEAEHEGVVLYTGHKPRIILSKDGRVRGFVTSRVDHLLDGEKGFNPGFQQNSEEQWEADTIIVAVGQSGDPGFLHEEDGIVVNHQGIIQVDPKTMATCKEGVYAGGDAVSGSRNVIEAIAAGRKAASSIDLFLGGDGIIDEGIVPVEIPDGWLGKKEDFLTTSRHGQLLRPWQQVSNCHPGEASNEEIFVAKFGEVEQGLDEMMALSQADRCLQCDLRTYLSNVILPPGFWLDFNADTIATVPETEGVYQLLNEQKFVTDIVGTSNLRQSLEEKLEDGHSAVNFKFEENPMYTQRESQLIQQFIQQYGHLPEGGDDVDDFY